MNIDVTTKRARDWWINAIDKAGMPASVMAYEDRNGRIVGYRVSNNDLGSGWLEAQTPPKYATELP